MSFGQMLMMYFHGSKVLSKYWSMEAYIEASVYADWLHKTMVGSESFEFGEGIGTMVTIVDPVRNNWKISLVFHPNRNKQNVTVKALKIGQRPFITFSHFIVPKRPTTVNWMVKGPFPNVFALKNFFYT